MAVENRDKRVAFRLTESEYELLAWAAAHHRRRTADAARLVALDWARRVRAQVQENQGQGNATE